MRDRRSIISWIYNGPQRAVVIVVATSDACAPAQSKQAIIHILDAKISIEILSSFVHQRRRCPRYATIVTDPLPFVVGLSAGSTSWIDKK
ncbi:hypothetical protein AB1N83_009766 [Pleurotus pulmonarius]